MDKLIKVLKNWLMWLGSGWRRWAVMTWGLVTVLSYKQVDTTTNMEQEIVTYMDWRIMLGIVILLALTLWGWYLYERE